MDEARHFALIVGLSEYPAVGKLKGPLNDLQDVRNWLMTDLRVPEANIIRWTDTPPQYRRPSADDFYDWVLDWVEKARQTRGRFPLGERLYVYYAGHGYNATTGQQSMIMPRSTPETWNVVPMVPLRESLRLRAHFEEIVVVFDACRDVLGYAIDAVWLDQPPAAPDSNQVKVFSAFASKTGKKAKEVDFGNGKWAGVLTQAFLAGARGYAADENGVVYAQAMKKFLIAAVKDRLGVDYEPDIDDGSDPNDPPWPLFQATRKLPRIVIQPVMTKKGEASFRHIRSGETVKVDLSTGTQVREVPSGYYGLTLPGRDEQKIIAAWEEKVVEV
jgi:hypothetical protein